MDTTINTDIAQTIKKNAGALIILGIIQIVVGMLAMTAPLAAGVGLAMLVGCMLLIGGAVELVGVFKAQSFGAGVLAFVGGMFASIVGLVMIARPGIALLTLTLFLSIYFFAVGVTRVIMALQAKPLTGWGWMLFDGTITILLGLMIGRRWPLSGAWAIGTLVGIHLMLRGISVVAMSAAVRSAAKDASEA